MSLGLQEWMSIIGLVGGMMGFGIAVILVPLIKWIHDVQSRTVDSERNAAGMFIKRADAQEMFKEVKADCHHNITELRSTIIVEHKQIRELIAEMRNDFRHHDALDVQRHAELKTDIINTLDKVSGV